MQLLLFTTKKKCRKCSQMKLAVEFRKWGHWCRECRIKYNREYYKIHKEHLSEQEKQYRKTHKERISQQRKRYRETHKEQIRKYRESYSEQLKNYYEMHKEHYNQLRSKWRQTPRAKTLFKQYKAKRKRELGFNPLNIYFPFSHAHHINDIEVVYIPDEIHKKFLTGEKENHRILILQYYGSIERMIETNLEKEGK